MFIGGTVKYSAEILGMTLPETSFPGVASPVREVLVRCDGRKADLTVLLGPVDSEAVALPAAYAAMMRVWGAILVTAPDAFITVSPPVQRDAYLEPAPTPGVVGLRAAIAVTVTCDAFVTVRPGPDVIQRARTQVVAPSWDPGASIVFETYARALGERDHAAQLLALYVVASLAIEQFLGLQQEPGQPTLDRELRNLDPAVPLLPPEGTRGKQETPFTRARNRLMHSRDRRITWDDAKAYASSQLGAFRALVAKLVARA